MDFKNGATEDTKRYCAAVCQLPNVNRYYFLVRSLNVVILWANRGSKDSFLFRHGVLSHIMALSHHLGTFNRTHPNGTMGAMPFNDHAQVQEDAKVKPCSQNCSKSNYDTKISTFIELAIYEGIFKKDLNTFQKYFRKQLL